METETIELKNPRIDLCIKEGVVIVPIDKKSFIINNKKFNLDSISATISFKWGDAKSEDSEVKNG